MLALAVQKTVQISTVLNRLAAALNRFSAGYGKAVFRWIFRWRLATVLLADNSALAVRRWRLRACT